MRIYTHWEMEQFDAVFKRCMSVSLAYDKNHPIQLNQIRHGNPTKELPKAKPIPKPFIDLIIKVQGLENFASLFTPQNYNSTMDRLIKYLTQTKIQPKEFELDGCIWVDKNPYSNSAEIVYRVEK